MDDKDERRQWLMEVHAERDRLLPLRSEATRTTIGMLRGNAAHASQPDLVPYLNLTYLMAVKEGRGEDELMAFALSLANWAVSAVVDLAQHTNRTVEQVLDSYETAIMAAAEAEADEGDRADQADEEPP
ncbi:hypothetical protein [Streptomyces murinus]|uniref:Uncharacterized protein n=1 Tax=Streptomyces murinus TaxID=33900 RepID=A0A7W3RMU2_STRMR|nr:hypothetical protein [Streptomyces murinus]MBA9055557.1 hypothetical protein [Streptomyces murinus]